MKVAIIGAGVSGLCAAIRLQETSGCDISEIVVFEREDRPGGLLQSTYHNGYWWDNGAFKFGHTNYLVKLLPDAFESFEGYTRKVWRNGQLQNFPFNLKRLLSQLSAPALLNLSVAYAYNAAKCSLGAGQENLETWLRCRLTRTLLEISGLEAYAGKLQGLPLNELSSLFGEQRLQYVHKLTRPGRIFKTAQGLYSAKKADGVPLVYPRTDGVGSISEKLAQYARQHGIHLRFGEAVQQISTNGSVGLDLAVHGRGGETRYHADYVLSTMPINHLAEVCQKGGHPSVMDALRQIHFMDLQMTFFIVRRPYLIAKYLTLYSFEKHHRWKRLVARALPNGTTSVLVETTFDPHKAGPDPGLADTVACDLTQEIGLFAEDEIAFRHSTHVSKAYPVYAIDYEKHTEILVNELQSDRLVTTGRNGRFFYSSTPKIIEAAVAAADGIIQMMAADRRHR